MQTSKANVTERNVKSTQTIDIPFADSILASVQTEHLYKMRSRWGEIELAK